MHNYIKEYTCIVLLLITVCLFGCSGNDIWEGIAIGSQVPSFTLKADDGSIVTPESMKGKIYLITFFNTECKDCQRELPVVQKLYDNYRYEISFLNIAREESADGIARYWNANGLSMPYYPQSDRTIFNLFANTGIPRIYLVDAKGIIIASFDTSGDLSYGAISRAIDNSLGLRQR